MEELLADILSWIGQILTRWFSRPVPRCVDGYELGLARGTGSDEETVGLAPSDLDRHLYVLGASGSGKTRLIELLVRQHIQRREGFCLVDPHGDLTRAILAYLYAEVERASKVGQPLDLDRVYLVEPFRDDVVIGLNPLDPCGAPIHPHIGELVAIFRRFWANSWGPRMEEIIRNALLTLAQSGMTLCEVTPLLTDRAFRERVVASLKDDTLRSFWRDRYEAQSEAAQLTASEPVLNKMGALLADPKLRAMLGQKTGALQFRRLMDEGCFLLLNCSKGHLRDAAYLLGSFVVAQLQSAALSRVDIPEAKRRRFTVFVDEFQHFRGEDFEAILCEARKFRLRLAISHQHLAQLEKPLQSAIFGNVATHVVFAVSPQDAGIVAKQFEDGAVDEQSLIHQGIGHATICRRNHLPTPSRILPVLPPTVSDDVLNDFAAALRSKHGQPIAKVEAEMRRRLTPPKTAGTGSSTKAAPAKSPRRKSPSAHAALPPSPDPRASVAPSAAPAPVREADDD